MIDIEEININQINPSPYNPRVMGKKEMKKLQKNMKEFGVVDPIIVNLKNNNIVGGHQRYTALKEAGVTKLHMIRIGQIGWVFQDTNLEIKDDNAEKILNISLNNISGEWEESKLTKLLTELEHNHAEYQLTGFDELDLESMKLDHEILLNTRDIEPQLQELRGDTSTQDEETYEGNYTSPSDEEFHDLEEMNEGINRGGEEVIYLEEVPCPHCGKPVNINIFQGDYYKEIDGLED